MMVMVSLNLADVMTAIRPNTSQPFPDDSDQPPSPGGVKGDLITEGEDLEPSVLYYQILLRGD